MGRDASGKWCLYTMRLTNTCFFGSLEMVYILRTSQHIYHLKWTMTTLEMLRSKIAACFHVTLPRRDTLSWKQKRHVNNYLLLSQYLVEMKTSQTRSVGYLRYPKVCKNPENFSVRLYPAKTGLLSSLVLVEKIEKIQPGSFFFLAGVNPMWLSVT